ncbi:pyridoxine/pyridoxamine 5'-phosphate oxidase [Streptomyces meridianus]|uniref:Pyridoxal 5'-phosphate synthase n=1 Tax=Streptomyces meridianus TaxID=2938945 RepID=A0ABT0X901_9ACTN|nr:pyridoxal 5'-phosphate synthase [Streptomyces meridianus]MCM2579009.1 pyridoxal 5'-phosphate synthase [Streptomyces meridianus]
MDSAPDQDRFRSTLRGLRVWDVELPGFDPDAAPADPLPLFRRWLCEAADAGQPEPHVMSLATADADGRPDARIVVLHDADEHGWHFGSHAGSRKGRQLADRPEAALIFYWHTVGRQVRVRGTVTTAAPEESAADLHARSTGALAAALVGRQSEVLPSVAELERASDDAWQRAQDQPEADVPSWTLYRLDPDEVEFFQGDARRRHVRLRYRRHAGGDVWTRELLWP